MSNFGGELRETVIKHTKQIEELGRDARVLGQSVESTLMQMGSRIDQNFAITLRILNDVMHGHIMVTDAGIIDDVGYALEFQVACALIAFFQQMQAVKAYGADTDVQRDRVLDAVGVPDTDREIAVVFGG